MQCRPYVHELEWVFTFNLIQRKNCHDFLRKNMKRYHTTLKETGVELKLWKRKTTQHSTAQNVRIWQNMAWESLITDRQEIWRSKGTKFTTGTTDSTAGKRIARTWAIVTTERNRNTTRWATETAAGQSTTKNSPWSTQGIITADIWKFHSNWTASETKSFSKGHHSGCKAGVEARGFRGW